MAGDEASAAGACHSCADSTCPLPDAIRNRLPQRSSVDRQQDQYGYAEEIRLRASSVSCCGQVNGGRVKGTCGLQKEEDVDQQHGATAVRTQPAALGPSPRQPEAARASLQTSAMTPANNMRTRNSFAVVMTTRRADVRHAKRSIAHPGLPGSKKAPRTPATVPETVAAAITA